MNATPRPSHRAIDRSDRQLWDEARGSAEADTRHALFDRYHGIAIAIARRHARRLIGGDIEFGDVRQFAFTGLIEAIDRFDPARGVRFEAYAAHRISGSIRDGINKMSDFREQIAWRHRMRRDRMASLRPAKGARGASDPLAELAEIAVGLALGFMLEDSSMFRPSGSDPPADQPSAYDHIVWDGLLGSLGDVLEALGSREHAILKGHYMDGIGFDELGRLFGLTKGRISQIHRETLQRLRKQLAASGHFRLEK